MAFDGANFTPNIVNFMGLGFHALDADAVLDAVAARASIDAPFAYVATPNVDHMVGLSKEPGRRPLYQSAWMLVNDSSVLARLARKAGVRLPVATGADLVERLFDSVIDRHEPITIIGGERDAIDALARRYRLTDVRWHQPPMGLKHKPGAIVDAAEFAAKQGARFTLICVGAPQQEMIAYAMHARGDATGVGLCAGAALDFLSGKAKRAPKWMRAAGLEWLHRFVSEPRRMWRRYLVDGPKVFSLFSAWRASMAAASAA